MTSNTIVDSRLYIRLDLGLSIKANTLFQTNPLHQAHFATQLLLYDKIVIPTKDFAIIPILISWMGLKAFRESLDSESIAFIRPKSLLGYAGNGNGISGFDIRASKENPFKWWQEATFGALDSAPEIQLRHHCPFITSDERSAITEKVIALTKLLDWDNEFFMKNIVHESYMDIKNSEQLSSFVLQREPSGTKLADLPRLSGIAPDQMKVSHLETIRDGVDLVLRVAEMNHEIVMGQLFGKCDIGTSNGAEKLIKNKLLSAGATPDVLKGFLNILELNNIPDVGIAIATGTVSIPELWKLRNKTVSQKFRNWLREADVSNARELEKLFVQSLGTSSVYSSLPVRLLRFAATTAAGALNPAIGTILSTADSFFIEKWLDGYTPKLFLEQLGELPGLSKPND